MEESNKNRKNDLNDIKEIKKNITEMSKNITNLDYSISFPISVFYNNYIMYISNIIRSTKAYYSAYYNALNIENSNVLKIIAEIKTNNTRR